jgi:hypothetical protein
MPQKPELKKTLLTAVIAATLIVLAAGSLSWISIWAARSLFHLDTPNQIDII